MLGFKTKPEFLNSSKNFLWLIPFLFILLKSIPDDIKRYIEDWDDLSFMQSNSKLNCQVRYGLGNSPFSLDRVIPNWINFNESTFNFNDL